MERLAKRMADLKANKKGGFTLMELVVVIGIMAILALIMVPNLTAYIQKADTAKTQANMKNVHTAAELVRATDFDAELDYAAISEFANQDSIGNEASASEFTVEVVGDDVIVKSTAKNGTEYTFDGKSFTP